MSSYDVAIIGAGIVGAACALECGQSGLKVAIIEPGPLGGGATAAGMGHIVVMDDSDAQFALTHYSQELWTALAPGLPPEAEYLPCGTLWIAADEEEMAEVRRKQQYYCDRGVQTDVLDSRALTTAESNLRRGLAGALLVPGDSVIYAPAAARWFVEQSGAKVHAQAAIELTASGVRLADGS